MGMLNFVLDSFRGEIFEFKVKRRVLVASTVMHDKKFIPTLYTVTFMQNTAFQGYIKKF